MHEMKKRAHEATTYRDVAIACSLMRWLRYTLTGNIHTAIHSFVSH